MLSGENPENHLANDPGITRGENLLSMFNFWTCEETVEDIFRLFTILMQIVKVEDFEAPIVGLSDVKKVKIGDRIIELVDFKQPKCSLGNEPPI